jgi:hypothetical protein
MPRRGPAWIWSGWVIFIVIVAALVTYLIHVGLDKADKLAGIVGMILALVALGAPYLLPSSPELDDGGHHDVHVEASSPGSVAIGGSNYGSIRTRIVGLVTGAERSRRRQGPRKGGSAR